MIIDRLHRELTAGLKSQYDVTFSVGVGVFQKVPDSEDTVIAFSDKLMYRAKTTGKDSVVYDTHPAAQ
jgi:PleD family two-component response regulator